MKSKSITWNNYVPKTQGLKSTELSSESNISKTDNISFNTIPTKSKKGIKVLLDPSQVLEVLPQSLPPLSTFYFHPTNILVKSSIDQHSLWRKILFFSIIDSSFSRLSFGLSHLCASCSLHSIRLTQDQEILILLSSETRILCSGWVLHNSLWSSRIF